jgi:carbon starvation protein
MAFLLVMTVWALISQLGEFWDADERWVLVPRDVIILVLALWLIANLRMRALVSERRTAILANDTERGEVQQ